MAMTFDAALDLRFDEGDLRCGFGRGGRHELELAAERLAGVLEPAGDRVEIGVAGVLADVDDRQRILRERGRGETPWPWSGRGQSFFIIRLPPSLTGPCRQFSPLPLGAGIDQVRRDDGHDQQRPQHAELPGRQPVRDDHAGGDDDQQPGGEEGARGSCRVRRRCRCRPAWPSAPSAIRRRARGRSAPSRGARPS